MKKLLLMLLFLTCTGCIDEESASIKIDMRKAFQDCKNLSDCLEARTEFDFDTGECSVFVQRNHSTSFTAIETGKLSIACQNRIGT